MGFSVMLWGAEKLVSVEYWCPLIRYMYFPKGEPMIAVWHDLNIQKNIGKGSIDRQATVKDIV